MRKSDDYRLGRIIEFCERLLCVIEEDGITRKDIVDDFHTQWLLSTPLINIGEQAYGLSNEFKVAHPEISWRSIAGLRHRLVHDYEGTNWDLIADVTLVEIPVLLTQVRQILEEPGDEPIVYIHDSES